MSWDIRFPNPVELPSGKLLHTLRDAGHHITALPKSEQMKPAWQNAMHVLLQAADHLGPVEFARLGMMQALYPKGEPVYDTGRKDPHWGRRKLARDR